ncbi:glycerol-3-phosphate dehydrogenase [Savitreella phatthalungensis]
MNTGGVLSNIEQAARAFTSSITGIDFASAPRPPLKVAVIGSGNWGTAVAKIVAENCLRSDLRDRFSEEVKMWMYEEEIEHAGAKRKLTEVFNEHHENVKYLKGVTCPPNLRAVPVVREAARDADVLVVVIPHQFVDNVCTDLKGFIKPGAVAISGIKGVAVSKEGVKLFSQVISDRLSIYCGAFSGANIALEVAQEKFSETTIAWSAAKYPGANPLATTDTLRLLFERPYFRIGLTDDVAGVSLAGALKNVVAVAAGLVDGLGDGDNAKAAIMRIGLGEMVRFGQMFFGASCRADTFLEHSCGVADLITSCAGGRNRKCAVEFVRTGKSMDQLERELLKGQKLQGAATALEVHELLTHTDRIDDFPLFTAVYDIVYGGVPPQQLFKLLVSPDERKKVLLDVKPRL